MSNPCLWDGMVHAGFGVVFAFCRCFTVQADSSIRCWGLCVPVSCGAVWIQAWKDDLSILCWFALCVPPPELSEGLRAFSLLCVQSSCPVFLFCMHRLLGQPCMEGGTCTHAHVRIILDKTKRKPPEAAGSR